MDQKKKNCLHCGEYKLLNEFKMRSDKPHLIMSYCTICYNKRRQERRSRNHPDLKSKDKDRELRRKYKLSLIEYNKMLEDQDGVCAICRSNPGDKMLAVDHNHTTGNIRALLCHHCNTGIGHFRENPLLLQNAMNYLFLHNT